MTKNQNFRFLLEIFETNGAFGFGGRVFALKMFHQTVNICVNTRTNGTRDNVDAGMTVRKMFLQLFQTVQRLNTIFALIHRICQFVNSLVFGQSFITVEPFVAIAAQKKTIENYSHNANFEVSRFFQFLDIIFKKA